MKDRRTKQEKENGKDCSSVGYSAILMCQGCGLDFLPGYIQDATDGHGWCGSVD